MPTDELAAARLLVAESFGPQAVSRAYYAAFYAAEEALLELGHSFSPHAGVVSGFGRYVVVESGLDRSCGRMLHLLFERRTAADYGELEVSRDDATAAVDDAERLVHAVDDWLTRRAAT